MRGPTTASSLASFFTIELPVGSVDLLQDVRQMQCGWKEAVG